MYYCFVLEDLEKLDSSDPLFIQAEYAKRTGQYICCDLSNNVILNKEQQKISIWGEPIFLRATCDSVKMAICMITKNGGHLFETLKDIEKIEHWDELPILKRDVFSLKFNDIINNNFTNEITRFFEQVNTVFIKSRKKGFCIKTTKDKILQKGEDVIKLIDSLTLNPADELLCSKCCEIKMDSLGSKEARFFVFENKIANCSRTIHSVKHSVPKSLILKAQEIVQAINKLDKFPNNYVLDIAEFIDDDINFIDVVELNPITTSLCYVNNSVFFVTVPEIENSIRNFGAGYEYCFDSIIHSERYVFDRYSSDAYEYIRENAYVLY